MTKSTKSTGRIEGRTNLLVIFGLGADKRPHAARFPASDEQAVRKAAELMGFQFVSAPASTLGALAARLPEGRIFATGRALVPYVKDVVYDQLLAHTKRGNGVDAASVSAVTGETDRRGSSSRAEPTDVRQILSTTALVGLDT